MTTTEHPHVLYDEDGYPKWVRADIVKNPREAFRLAYEEGMLHDHDLIDDHWDDDGCLVRYRLSSYTNIVRGIKLGWYVKLTEEDCATYFNDVFAADYFNSDYPYYPAREDMEGAVQYWEIPINE